MLSTSLGSVPFVLHIVIELPAAISFAFLPSATLSKPQSHAHALIRQYALLLFSTIIIAALFIPHDRNSDGSKMQERVVAGALALHHLGPLIRAVGRFRRGEGTERHLLAQPRLHALVHVLCCFLLGGRGCLWW